MSRSFTLQALRFEDKYTGAVVRDGNVVASTVKTYDNEKVALMEAGKLRAKMKRPYKKRTEPVSPAVQQLRDKGVAYIHASKLINKLEKGNLSPKKVLDIAAELAKIDIA